MCFNISISHNKYAIERKMNAEFEPDLIFEPQKHITAFTNPLIPVITSDNYQTIQLFNWGLIPHWVKSNKKANELRKMTYNAKCETLQVKPSFRYSIRNKKCLIIADGFYEWQTKSTSKICYYMNTSNNDLFTFAGIWSDWIDTTTGEEINSVSIITQPANSKMSQIHNIKKRQPVIITMKNRINWFNSGLDYDYILKDSFNIELNNKIVESPLKYN